MGPQRNVHSGDTGQLDRQYGVTRVKDTLSKMDSRVMARLSEVKEGKQVGILDAGCLG
jgi:hypothetical protein